MTARLRVPLPVPLRALRVHRTPRSAHDPDADPRAMWFLELRELAVQRVRRHAELSACVTELRQLLGVVPGMVRQNLTEVAALSTEIGLAVAREVIGDAIERGAIDPTPVVKRCLEDAVAGLGETQLQVRVHPEDLALVVSQMESAPDLGGGIEGVAFHPDPTLPRGAVRVDTAAGRLLYDPREVLARLADELRRTMADAVPAEAKPA